LIQVFEFLINFAPKSIDQLSYVTPIKIEFCNEEVFI
jgi:hypothetical protein